MEKRYEHLLTRYPGYPEIVWLYEWEYAAGVRVCVRVFVFDGDVVCLGMLLVCLVGVVRLVGSACAGALGW